LLKDRDVFYELRDKFNENPTSELFLTLNLSSRHQLIRYNRNNEFSSTVSKSNKGYLRKEDIRLKAIANVIKRIIFIKTLFKKSNITIENGDFRACFDELKADDFFYCDPPYLLRKMNYYGFSFEQKDWEDLINLCVQTESSVAISNWFSDVNGINPYVNQLKTNGNFRIKTDRKRIH